MTDSVLHTHGCPFGPAQKEEARSLVYGWRTAAGVG